MEVEIDLIRPSPYQPRLLFNIDELKLEIERDGLLSELVVRKQGRFFELVDGERRLRALKELGWKTVPVRIVEIDDTRARRSVYKVNKIRENYTVEEEARYFKRLQEEGMTPWEISKELNVDFHWVLAHLNVFKFPEEIQNAVWTKQISISHMVAIESVIGRNLKEALAVLEEVLRRKLTLTETKRIIRQQEEEVEKMRIEAAVRVLPRVTPEAIKLETPEDFLRAAKALKKVAKKKRDRALTPEEKALREAEKKRRIEERQRKIEERRRREQQRIEEEIRKTAWRIRAEERHRIEEEVKEKTGEESIDGLVQRLKKLREKIQKLESKKASLMEKKFILTQALSFNCPHCNHPCVIYQEGDRYFVE